MLALYPPMPSSGLEQKRVDGSLSLFVNQPSRS
jgi:hypothetical protein